MSFELSRFVRERLSPKTKDFIPLRIPTRRYPAGVDRSFDDAAGDVSQIIKMVAQGHVFRAECAEAREIAFENPRGLPKAPRPTGA